MNKRGLTKKFVLAAGTMLMSGMIGFELTAIATVLAGFAPNVAVSGTVGVISVVAGEILAYRAGWFSKNGEGSVSVPKVFAIVGGLVLLVSGPAFGLGYVIATLLNAGSQASLITGMVTGMAAILLATIAVAEKGWLNDKATPARTENAAKLALD